MPQSITDPSHIDAVLLELQQGFHPPWYLRSGFVQTIFGALRPRHAYAWELHERPLADGDFQDIATIGPPAAPLICIVPGMGGNWQSASINHVVQQFLHDNWQLAVINHRGFGRRINQVVQNTHAGAYNDIACGIAHIAALRPGVPVYAVGLSLGASQLLNYVANCPDNGLQAIAAVATPFNLHIAEQVTPKLYQRYILRDIQQHYLAKLELGMDLPLSAAQIQRLHTFRQLDEALTAPLHGYPDADTYYTQCSCLQRLGQVVTPSLLISALDDPFYRPDALPTRQQLGAHMQQLVFAYGGHLGLWSHHADGHLHPYWAHAVMRYFKCHDI